MNIHQQIQETLAKYETGNEHEKANALLRMEIHRVEWLKVQQEIITQQERLIESLQEAKEHEINCHYKSCLEYQELAAQQTADIERLRHITGLLAGQIDIANEVFDYLSAEADYEYISSKAKGQGGNP